MHQPDGESVVDEIGNDFQPWHKAQALLHMQLPDGARAVPGNFRFHRKVPRSAGVDGFIEEDFHGEDGLLFDSKDDPSFGGGES